MNHKSDSLKMFVSYSHKDESFLSEFRKHLIHLERSKLLHIWSDKELVTGDHLDSKIKTHLGEADIVAFLISSDFLSSWYCYEVELMNTINSLEHNDIRIIPIVLRSCSWKSSELGKYLAATKNGEPITKYDEQDDAWVEVAESIEKAANKYLLTKSSKSVEESTAIIIGNENSILKQNFIEYLNDTEVSFQHKFKDNIILDDIYIYPDLKNLKQEYDEFEKTISSSKLIELYPTREKLLILGSEQSGKTSLCKILFKSYLKAGHLPLLCFGRNIKTTNLKKIIRKLVNDQYSDYSVDSYLTSSKPKVLIIDDFDKLALNARNQSQCLNNVMLQLEKIVVVAESSIKYDEKKLLEFSDYYQFEIKPFGHLLRGELIEKWSSIGRNQTINITELHNQTDDIAHHVDAIIRKNILPRKPIYILTIIQMLDTAKPSDYSLTSYGHCYQTLIQSMLKKTNIKVSDLDLYDNYLSELSYFIFMAGVDELSDTLFNQFKLEYSNKYLIKSHDEVLDCLLSSGILREIHDAIFFGHRYIFYFYVSKYLSENINSKKCKKEIEGLCNKIHTEKNANILIFLVHHSKDQGVIDEILLQASVVFDRLKEATLEVEETKHMIDYIASIPKLVIEQRNIDEERRKRLVARDEHDELNDTEDVENAELEQDDNDREILSEINRSFRIVEIIGQILRNRYGSLSKIQLTELCMAAYSSGLKFLNFFLSITKNNQEHLLIVIQDMFRENTNISDDEISNEARKIFLMLCYGTSYSVIKKIANSVGSNKLMPIFEELCNKNPESPAIKLIWIAIQLEFSKQLPKNLIEKTYVELDNNPIAQRLLQEIVIQHLYLNHVEYKDRQWISSKLHLQISSKLLLQGEQGKN